MTKEYSDYLAHHGVKGQKWGKRQYQNEDGSLTQAGKERYGVGDGNDQPKKEVTDTQKSKAKKILAIGAAVAVAAAAAFIASKHIKKNYIKGLKKGAETARNYAKQQSDHLKAIGRSHGIENKYNGTSISRNRFVAKKV